MHFADTVVSLTVNRVFHSLEDSKYSQTCLKGSPKGRTKSVCLRQVTP